MQLKYSDNPEKMEEERRKIKKYKYIGESANFLENPAAQVWVQHPQQE